MAIKEYEPGTAFPGVIGRTIRESSPAWPRPLRAKPAAPSAHGKGTPARGQLYVGGKLAAQGDLPVTIPLDIGIIDGLSCGRDEGSAVTTDYAAPFPFTGALEKIVLDVSGDLIEDRAAELRSVMAHQ